MGKAFLKLEKESSDLVKRERAKALNFQEQLARLESRIADDQFGWTRPSCDRKDGPVSLGDTASRIAALEVDLADALGDELSDEVEQELQDHGVLQKSGCHWSAI